MDDRCIQLKNYLKIDVDASITNFKYLLAYLRN